MAIGEEELNMVTIVADVKKTVVYYRAIEMSRRRGEALPILKCEG